MNGLTIVLVNTAFMSDDEIADFVDNVTNLSVDGHYVFDNSFDGAVVDGAGFTLLVQDYSDDNGDCRYYALEDFLTFSSVEFEVLCGGYWRHSSKIPCHEIINSARSYQLRYVYRG